MNKQRENRQANNVSEAYDSRVVEVRRTSKARDGGRDFSFSALAVVGDGKGRLGMGRGKAKEVTVAVQKANNEARRDMSLIALKGSTILYPVKTQYGATTVLMKPSPEGTGVIAGGALRAVFEVLGVKNITAKIIGSSNPTNVITAAIKGLKNVQTPEIIAQKRGKTISGILGRKKHE